MRQDMPGFGAIIAEVIERQRPRARIDVVDGFIDVAIAANRQQRTEELLLHHQGLFRRVDQQGRCNLAYRAEFLLRRIHLDAAYPTLPGIE
ncbi:hypothetical protein D3C80_1567490 [compost metagenome]